MAMDTTKQGFVYKGYQIPSGMTDLATCLHCGTPHPPTMTCENCGSFAIKLVKVKEIDPRCAPPVANVQVQLP